MDVNDLHNCEWFPGLEEEVRLALEAMSDRRDDHRPALEYELQRLKENQKGWAQSLAKPDLSTAIRAAVETEWEEALARQRQIESLLAEEQVRGQQRSQVLDSQQIVARLNRLDEVLASNNPTYGNLELSLHIDRIDCFSDGHVELRTCKLGILGDAAELLAENAETTDAAAPDCDTARVRPRRRARLRTEGLPGNGDELKAAADMAADPHRFAGLPAMWFWVDTFRIPERKSWAKQYAPDVAAARATGLTMENLAARFGKTVPTIRASLRHAAKLDGAINLPKKMPRSRWHEDHAVEVAALKASGKSTLDIARHYGKSDTLIRSALKHAERLSSESSAG